MGLFRDQILRTPVKTDLPTLLDILKRIILDQIQMDRDGEAINPHNIKANVYMLEGLYESEQEVEDEKLYLMSFEQDFLKTSAAFYREEGERLLKESDAGTYCRHRRGARSLQINAVRKHDAEDSTSGRGRAHSTQDEGLD
jgi:cullin 3